MLKDYLVDVPVRVNVWIRHESQKAQFEVIKQARPSILFLISDGGRNEKEWEAIRLNRKLYDEGIDWNCKVYKIYEEKNNGLYTMSKKGADLVWSVVDRCIFLEDDLIPAVSYFRFCAELLEKYKDDERIEMICGNNTMVVYEDALPNDYFFTESGWSITGGASWKRVAEKREYPFDYADNEYIQRCLKDNLTPFWYEKVKGYCEGKLVDNHRPGGEYYHAINSVLYHRVSIVATRNMITNVGYIGEHANITDIKKAPKCLGAKAYEIEFPIKHPKYVIDDKNFSRIYAKELNLKKKNRFLFFIKRCFHFVGLVFTGKAIEAIKRKKHKKKEET